MIKLQFKKNSLLYGDGELPYCTCFLSQLMRGFKCCHVIILTGLIHKRELPKYHPTKKIKVVDVDY